MIILHFVPSSGCFLGGQRTFIREPTLDHLRAFIRQYPLAWVTA